MLQGITMAEQKTKAIQADLGISTDILAYIDMFRYKETYSGIIQAHSEPCVISIVAHSEPWYMVLLFFKIANCLIIQKRF